MSTQVKEQETFQISAVQVATVTLQSASPISFSRHVVADTVKGETKDDYERRTWRERCHDDGNGNLVIPGSMVKHALQNAGKYLGMKIPGMGTKTYTQKLTSGLMILDDIVLPVKKSEVEGQWLFVPADGKTGGSKRVLRCFPVVREWKGTFQIHVLDPIIDKAVLEEHLRVAGLYIGIGRWRPEKGGQYGRFTVTSIDGLLERPERAKV